MLCHHQRPVHHVLVVVGQRYCSGARGFAIDPGQSDVQPGDFNFTRSCRNQPIDPIALTVGQFAFDLSIFVCHFGLHQQLMPETDRNAQVDALASDGGDHRCKRNRRPQRKARWQRTAVTCRTGRRAWTRSAETPGTLPLSIGALARTWESGAPRARRATGWLM